MADRIATPALTMSWAETPWDTRVFGFPVLHVDAMEAHQPDARRDLDAFVASRDRAGAGLVSCRLGHERLRESMLLEDIGFRFIEMIYQPVREGLEDFADVGAQALDAAPPSGTDMQAAIDIAGTAFSNERFHVDPRLPSEPGRRRYQNWVADTAAHATQRLTILREAGEVVGFFVTEQLADGTCYWHLNALAPHAQGRGIGRRAWMTMLQAASRSGATKVRSSVVARNVRVLNLYASMGFRLAPPAMTFHWVRGS